MKNTGLDLEREKLEQDGTEWQFGATSPSCLFAVPESDREANLPIGELQNIGEEKSGCVSRAYVNILETKFTYAYNHNLISPENKKWFVDNGYVNGIRIVFADANIEILSGTTRQGNSLKAPIDTIRKVGLVPKSLLPQLNTWDAHYDPARITPEIKALGENFLKRFSINYEQVYLNDLTTLLAQDTVALAAYAWPMPIDGEYPPQPGLPFNHCFMGFSIPLIYIFDNYLDNGAQGDFIKKLFPDYIFYQYGYRAYISAQNVPSVDDEIPAQVFWALSNNDLISYFLKWWEFFSKKA